jgi:hypothetical protein
MVKGVEECRSVESVRGSVQPRVKLQLCDQL